MKNIFKSTLALLIISLTFLNVGADDDDRNDFVSWEKPRISSVYNEADRKLVFLVQFNIQDYTDQSYKYDFRVSTIERSKSCLGDFTITSSTIYAICGVLVTDSSALDQEHSIYIEARDNVDNNKETELYKTFNIGVFGEEESQEKIGEIDSEDKLNIEDPEEKTEDVQGSTVGEVSELEIKINEKLNIFFTKIETFSLERKLKLINKVLSILKNINTNNLEKLEIINIIEARFTQEKVKLTGE